MTVLPVSRVRTDQLTGAQALVAPSRAGVAGAFRRRTGAVRLPAGPGPCPFCPEAEAICGPEVARLTGPAGWSARSVLNKFPAASDEPGTGAGVAVTGRHEVVVLTRGHDTQLPQLPATEVTDALLLMHRRTLAMAAAGWPGVLAFVNVGVDAGASQPHPHGQVLGVGTLPPLPATEAHRSRHTCPVCADVADAARVVTRGAGLVAWVPEASLTALELRFAPVGHRLQPDGTAGEAAALAGLILRVLGAVWETDGPAGFNLVWHVSTSAAAVHWHVHLLVRHRPLSSVEVGGGLMLVSVQPEQVAARLAAALAG